MNINLLKNQISRIAAITFSVCITAVIISAADGVPAGQTEKLIREVPSGSPDINGIIERGEWSESNKIVMNENTCTASPWSGSIESSADVYFLWDEDGLYIAAKITDLTEAYSSEKSPESVLSGDALQLGLNPGMLITGGHPGEFFTFSLPADAKKNSPSPLYIIRQNYADYNGIGSSAGGELIDEKCYKATGQKVSDGWQFECFLAWNQVNTVGINSQNPTCEALSDPNFSSASTLIPENGLSFGFMLCYLDRPGSSGNFTTGSGLGFNVEHYGGILTLTENVIEYNAKSSPAPGTFDLTIPIICIFIISSSASLMIRKKLKNNHHLPNYSYHKRVI